MSLLTHPTVARSVLTSSQKRELSALSHEWAKSLTHDESFVTVEYTQVLYRYINDALRSGQYENMTDIIALLDSAIAKSTLPMPRVVWRGVQFEGSIDFTVGQEIVMDAFTSTTAQPVNAVGILNRSLPHGAVYEMIINSGAPVDALSVKEGREFEIIVPRNARFVITDILPEHRFLVKDIDESIGYEYDYCAATLPLVRMEQVG